jgi:hypothetical protein
MTSISTNLYIDCVRWERDYHVWDDKWYSDPVNLNNQITRQPLLLSWSSMFLPKRPSILCLDISCELIRASDGPEDIRLRALQAY